MEAKQGFAFISWLWYSIITFGLKAGFADVVKVSMETERVENATDSWVEVAESEVSNSIAQD